MAFAHQFDLNVPITDYERVRESFFYLNNTPTNYSEDDLANPMDFETEVLSPNVTGHFHFFLFYFNNLLKFVHVVYDIFMSSWFL